MDLTTDDVAKQLALQGYRVPAEDLAEITHRVNALITRLRELDLPQLMETEPWPVQPMADPGV